MATFEITIDNEKIQHLLQSDRGMAVLLEPILNQMLQAEMTEHLGAESDQRTDTRQGYRNGSYERQLTTRVGTIKLEVPRDRDGTFQTRLFQRYQRSEKALVLALMQMVVQGVSTRRVKKITTKLCGRKFSKSTVSRLTTELDGQVEAWAKRPLEKSYPFLVLDAMHVKVRRQGAVRSTTVLTLLATTLAKAGRDHQSQSVLDEALLTVQEIEYGWRRSLALNNLAVELSEVGYVHQSQLVFNEARSTAHVIGHGQSRAVAMGRLAIAMAEAGQIDEAHLTTRMIKDDRTRTKAMKALAFAWAKAGYDDQAHSVLNESFAAAQVIADHSLRAGALRNLAASLAKAGFERKSQAMFSESFIATQMIKDDLPRAVALQYLSGAQVEAGQFDGSRPPSEQLKANTDGPEHWQHLQLDWKELVMTNRLIRYSMSPSPLLR